MAHGRKHEPSHVKVSKDLGIAIVTGRHPPGTILLGEVEYAERLGVSRSVVREALRMLSAKGLVESRPKAGTRVRERNEWNMLDPQLLGWMFEGAPPLEFVRNLFQLRMIIEPAAAELAAAGRSSRQLAQMGHALEQMDAHGLTTEIGQAADQRFHTIILEASGNELIVSLSSTISAAVRWTTFFKYRTSRHPHNPMEDHRPLFEAIAKSDPALARTATQKLIEQALVDTETALNA